MALKNKLKGVKDKINGNNNKTICTLLNKNIEAEGEAGSDYREMAGVADRKGHESLGEFSRLIAEQEKDHNRTLRWWRNRLCR